MTSERERGQVIVEFALAASLALFLIFGVIDFGRALFADDLVAGAARVGTRFAIVNATACKASKTTCEAAIVDYVKSKMSAGDAALLIPTPAIVWQQVNSADCYDAGCSVKITIDYKFSFAALPFASRTLSSTSQMAISQ